MSPAPTSPSPDRPGSTGREDAGFEDTGLEVTGLEVTGLEVALGKVQVLFDVDLRVEPGRTVAIVGTNGAGKTTLLRAVSGLVPSRAGRIAFDGEDLARVPVEARVDRGIVHVQGGAAVFPSLTVEENLDMAAFRVPREERASRVAESIGRFPVLQERPRLEAERLSGGQQQMLALAMALVHRPKLLLVDELSLGLAPVVVTELLETILRLAGEGMTMLLVEQSLNVASVVADRIVFMEKGRVRFDGAVDDLRSRDDLARAIYLGDR